MEWEKASVELGVALDQLISGFNCRRRPMFGSPCYFVNDQMFTGVKGSVVFLRLSEDDRRAIMAENSEVRPFEPRPLFFMKEYVEISASKAADPEFMTRWLQRSYEYTLTLPPKVKKHGKR